MPVPHNNMAEGETDEQETLIRADDLQELSVGGAGASDGGGGNGGGGGAGGSSMLALPSLLQQPPPAWHLPLHCAALVVVAAALVIMLPVYLESINIAGDAYSGLLFFSLFTAAPIVLCVQVRYSYFCQLGRLGPPSPARVFRLGAAHGLATLMAVYALDRRRVVCHAQEPLMGLVVMYMIIIYFFYRGPELSSAKMFSLCGVLSGLFLAVDFQLNNKFRCRGAERGSEGTMEGYEWGMEAHSLWTIVYAVALFLFTLAWLLLEREVLSKKGIDPGRHLITTVSGVAGGGGEDTEALVVVTGSGGGGGGGGGLVLVPPPSLPNAKWELYMVWFTLASLATTLALLWTDFFTTLGKAGSPSEFVHLAAGAWRCHFHWGGECGPTALYGWSMAALHVMFLGLLGKVMAATQSMVFALATTALALPIQAIWWSLFTMGGPLGMVWQPQVTGELVFSLLGAPVMVACLCFWCHVDARHAHRTNSLLLT
ncbi:uncharacterized protein LOC127008065 isoform X2 [Eriocheir sinensis]|uniref:uncharacterized protein LOC127008065 isoform X2 n=1 Tax=Eriocheir sinensis TaxID=95602 RepID=UPI0021C5C5A6|nr:uncharacterized protein LOC127008065 isoform X2 [Eriocheir sinensis]